MATSSDLEALIASIIGAGGVKSSAIEEGGFRAEKATHSLSEILAAHKYFSGIAEAEEIKNTGCLLKATGFKR